jgi:fatty aldehyde decarbonylase
VTTGIHPSDDANRAASAIHCVQIAAHPHARRRCVHAQRWPAACEAAAGGENVTTLDQLSEDAEHEAMCKLMGLTVFGESVAARTYALMGELKPEWSALLRKFAQMEGSHGKWFAQASTQHGFTLDRAFADKELGYLLAQVEDHYAQRDFDALVVLQGFIVECLAIAAYEPFVSVAHKWPGMQQLFQTTLDEERYHVDWVVRYLRLRFFDNVDEFVALTQRVNVQGIDCIGGTMMNITDYLDAIGISGADCAGTMADSYSELLETIGMEHKKALANVVTMFMPAIRKYRRGEQTK